MSKTIHQNLKASFWIRFLAMSIDLLLFIVLVTVTTLLVINKQTSNFYQPYFYYIWLSLIIVYTLTIWVFVPLIFKGRTLGLWITRLKIIPKNTQNKLASVICQRQLLYAFLWTIVFCLFMILISPQTFIKIAQTNKSNLNQLTVIQRGFMSVPVALSSVAALLDAFMVLTTARASRVGWNDTFSNSYTVYVNKYEDVLVDEWSNNNLKPKSRPLPKINFKN